MLILQPELTEHRAKPHIHTCWDTKMKLVLHKGMVRRQVKDYPADFKRQSTAFMDVGKHHRITAREGISVM